MNYIATGKTEDGEKLTANIHDLNTFLQAGPEDLIYVYEENGTLTTVKKGDVVWNVIKQHDHKGNIIHVNTTQNCHYCGVEADNKSIVVCKDCFYVSPDVPHY